MARLAAASPMVHQGRFRLSQKITALPPNERIAACASLRLSMPRINMPMKAEKERSMVTFRGGVPDGVRHVVEISRHW